MGMGEPLLNYRNVHRALQILNDSSGLKLGKRRITVSTSGIVPAIYKLSSEFPVNLAISLHAVNNDLRNELVPINKTYPLDILMEACRNYHGVRSVRKVTFEYVMLNGINDSESDANELRRLLHGIPCLVNLIPFNPWPGSRYTSSSNNAIYRFAERLYGQPNLKVTIRWPRGRDIMAACGQLATKSSQPQLSPQSLTAELFHQKTKTLQLSNRT